MSPMPPAMNTTLITIATRNIAATKTCQKPTQKPSPSSTNSRAALPTTNTPTTAATNVR